MLATGSLYDPAAFLAKQRELLGYVCVNIQFVRLPYVAVILSPLSRLPYSAAYAIWQLLSVASLAVFAWLWPARRAVALLICCWFPPVAANLANGQDVTYLLLSVAIAAWLVPRGREFAAGLVLSLCAAKFHLCLFLPVLIVARRMWRLGAGLASGAAVLLGISFLAAGASWPSAYLQTLRSPAVNPGMSKSSLVAVAMATLHGPALWAFLAGLMLLAGLIVYRVAQRHSFPLALGAALAGGPIVAFHVYSQDYLLMLPLLLTLVSGALSRAGNSHTYGPANPGSSQPSLR
jgi:hypothetical protein